MNIKEKQKQINDWVKKDDFIQHIKETVIPDLDDNGDFEMATSWRLSVRFLENPCITMIDKSEYL